LVFGSLFAQGKSAFGKFFFSRCIRTFQIIDRQATAYYAEICVLCRNFAEGGNIFNLKFMHFLSIPIETLALPLAFCFVAGLSFYLGLRTRNRKLQSEIRHTNHELNELHVQCKNLHEIIDNQELDIKRYVAELQLFTDMQREWLEEKVQLQITLDQSTAFHAPTTTSQTEHLSHESYLLMVQLWKKEIQQVRSALVAKEAELASLKLIMQFLSDENKKLRLTQPRAPLQS
jgi:hypothetical protein